MHRRDCHILLAAFGLALAAATDMGCSTVDPKPDYQRVAERVAEATSQPESYRPDEEVRVAQRLQELLAGGITADEAVQICLLNNPKLQATYFNVGVARADVVQSGLLANPSLALSFRLPEGGGLPDLEAGLAQNIADLWQIPARKRAAERSLDQMVLDLAREVSIQALEAKAAYFRAIKADREREIAVGNVAIARQLVDLALARQEAGAGSAVDVNLSRSELLATELALRVATLARFEARAELAKILGLTTAPDRLELVEALPDPPQWALASDRVFELARVQRLDLQAAENAALAAEARWQEEQLKVFRSVEVGVAMERNARRALPGRKVLADTARASVANGALTAPEIQSRSQRRAEKRAEIETILGPTIDMTLPIFDQNQAQIARALYLYQQASKTLDALLRELTQEARVVCERACTAWDNARFYRDRLLPLRESSLKLSQDAYQAGRISFLSVLEAERMLLEARAGYVDSLQASATALVELEKTTGQPMARILEAINAKESLPAGTTRPASSRPESTNDADRK
jgi:cobalt-zinc-cadmium efflux system outer membrane protein